MNILDFYRHAKHAWQGMRTSFSDSELDAGMERTTKLAQKLFEPIKETLTVNATPNSDRTYRVIISNGANRFEEDHFIRVTIGHFNENEANAYALLIKFFASFPLVHGEITREDIQKRSFTVEIPVASVLREKPLFFTYDGTTQHVHVNPNAVSAAIHKKFHALVESDLSMSMPQPPSDGSKSQSRKPMDLSAK